MAPGIREEQHEKKREWVKRNRMVKDVQKRIEKMYKKKNTKSKKMKMYI